MAAFNHETILSVQHWTSRLFSFTATRDPSFRFINGQFAMIGLEIDGKPILRAYSMCSANHQDTLEFFSIKVANGPLTSHLQHVQAGDTLLVGRKPTGTLVQDSLLPGKTLYLLATGTGFAPFASIIKDPEVYDRFETIVLAHGCREIAELGYSEKITADLAADQDFAELAGRQLRYYPTVTRETFRNTGRVSTLLETGKMPEDLGLPALNRETDRVMLCGSPEMLTDVYAILRARGFEEGSHSQAGHFVIEKAFVEK